MMLAAKSGEWKLALVAFFAYLIWHPVVAAILMTRGAKPPHKSLEGLLGIPLHGYD